MVDHINAQSLLGNFDEIEHLINRRDIDILCISETWLLPTIPSKLLNIPGYSVYRCDGGRGGGVCIYVKTIFNVTVLSTNLDKSPLVEDIWLVIQSHKFPSFIIGCIYRHPHAPNDSFNYLFDVFSHICLRKKPFLILGDINDNLLSPDNKIGNIIHGMGLTQLIDKPTRITSNSSTLIDLIITNKRDFIIQFDVLSCPVADHELISVTINIRKDKRPSSTKTFRSLEKYSQNMFCQLLLDHSFLLRDILDTDNINNQVQIFTYVFNNCLDTCAPMVTQIIKRPPAPWIDIRIKEAMRVRDELQVAFKSDKNNAIKELQYRTEKKRVSKALSDSKNKYFKQEFQKTKGNIRGTWNVIHRIIPKNKNISISLPYSEADIRKRAEDFNKYFAKVGENTFKKSQENMVDGSEFSENFNQIHCNPEKFRPQPVDMATLVFTIKSLKSTNAKGSDGIAYRFLIDSLPVLLSYILIIVNTSIVTGKYPDLWKHPHIAPIFKSGDTDSVSNYRPISLLPIISKILEKIVANQLIAYLEDNNLLSENQHGFRPHLSTETALLTITNQIYENIDQKKISLLLLLDLSKAFDSVSHRILLEKCCKLNIDSFWFEDYLKNRIQSVRMGSILSSSREINFGVPQGSILGPLLFLIYVNDLPQYMNDGLLVQYADDTQILLTGDISEIETMIRRAEIILDKARRYFNFNGLLLNEKKTQCIFFGAWQYINRIPNNTKIVFNNNELIPQQHVKNLGVYMDCSMTFNKHINELQNKIMGTLLFLNRITKRFDQDCRIMIVQSLILSVLNYALKIWGSTNKTNIQRVQRLQNFASKVAVGGAGRRDHASPIIENLKWLCMNKKYIYEICVFIFKIKAHEVPEWLFKLRTASEVRGAAVTTRQDNKLFIPHTRTNYGSRNLYVEGPKLWNTLPIDMISCQSLSCFKRELFNYLFHQ